MRRRRALVYLGPAVTVAAAGASAVLATASHATPAQLHELSRTNDIGTLVTAVAYAAVGTVILLRARGNRVGWLFWLLGPVVALNIMAQEYAVFALFGRAHPLTGGATAAWLQSWTNGVPVTLALSLLFLIFPDGRLLGPRWRFAVWAGASGFVLVAIGSILWWKVTTEAFTGVRNPFGVRSLGDGALVIMGVGWLLSLGAVCAGAASTFRRFRRAAGIEREQVKWLATAGVALAVTFVGNTIYTSLVTDVATTIGGLAVAVAAGVAILRYRLYEIDVIIRRTLIYGALSALLAGCYVAVILALQAAFGPVTQGNELAVACSTLVVAALFRPVRGRVQSAVDRRFYRSKVDAESMLARFGAHVQHEADLDTLTTELDRIVRDALQPSLVAIWLRNDPETATQ
jgi:hypothetical protein